MSGVGKALVNTTGIGILGKEVGKMFKSPDAPAIAPTPATPLSPDVDDTALMASRRRAATTLQNRSGRASTMLTGGDNTGTNKLGS